MPGLFYFRHIMNHYLLFNGSFHKESEPLITAGNRGLRYGDGLFETFRITGEKIYFSDWHFERLFNGLQLLQFELPAYFTSQYLSGLIISLIKKNRHNSARIRINIVRGNGGLYDPENHFPNCIIQSLPLTAPAFQLNENGLVTGIYNEARKAVDSFSHIKSNNYLPYSMAALHARRNRWNDALVLNTSGRVCDATIANVFIVKNEIVYTCPLSEGCVAGIIRRYLLQHLEIHGFTVQQQAITVDDLYTADEVFLTNTIKGIRWISHCGPAVYTNRLTTSIFNKLLKKIDAP